MIEGSDREIRISENEDVVVIGDLHMPQMSWSMIDSIIQTGRSFDTKSLVINGDIWNLDDFSEFIRKQHGCTWEEEMSISRQVFNKLQEWYDKFYICIGNHDKRISKITKYKMGLKELLILGTEEKGRKFTYTNRDYIIKEHNLGKFRICHSEEYARGIGFKAKQIGEKYRCNTIMGHSHMLSMTTIWNRNEPKFYIDGGCCCKFDNVEYEAMNTSGYTNWADGFVVLCKDEKPMIQCGSSSVVSKRVIT